MSLHRGMKGPKTELWRESLSQCREYDQKRTCIMLSSCILHGKVLHGKSKP